MLTTPLLQINSLQTEFNSQHGTVKAVDQISFNLYPAETIAIVGESGSGKSITSLSVLRLINSPPGKISGGEIIYNSRQFGTVDLLKLPEKEMQQIRGNEISMIFQEPMTSLNPVYTCGFQVREVLQLHKGLSRKEANEKTLTLFEQVKLPRPDKILKAYPHEISGGQKQRVMIAMAMACNPAILIADEPTTALDVTVQARILKLLEDLQVQHQTSVLFITHDLGVVAEIADRVLVMYKGKIVEQGPVLQLFENPQHPYTKGLLACRPALSFGKKVLPTVADFMEVSAEGIIRERSNSLVDNKFKNPAKPEPFLITNPLKRKNNPLLTVENLQVFFPVRKSFFCRNQEFIKAVDGVSFSVFPGETVALVGESGCGKTTLGRAILKMVAPTSGSINFNNVNIASLSGKELRRERKNLQMIFQDPYASLNPMQTIGEAIMEPMRVHNVYNTEAERRERVLELLQTVNLSAEHYSRYPHEFSGGQRQRISIARALALQPQCIICDESVSALDVSVQAQVLNLLNKLKADFGITYLFITHDLAVARFMADRIFVMSQGKIVESGTAVQIYEQPQHEYTRTLIQAIPTGEIKAIVAAQQKRTIRKAT
ncbi:ABC transporter ATP-binding protein [Adhaeribacter pallidiroseus]|uniref:Putative D,D-dipeptide transport ATP-binding protein DdpD n=1 Tax=Adhaeribacter pallidiroseus TaxID=2072847 RepID=A0A369QMT5_9BACT|nr:ABC transporter ATP-binding protein [Adhaeribacter pallidiroseus]RDC65660.1 putative D,D-dipeptide transport ATP-binding protein DdpD [Adhaeribacter pallidiroseus]